MKEIDAAIEALEMLEPYVEGFVDYSATAAEWPMNNAPKKLHAALAGLRSLKREPVAWAMVEEDGNVYDCISNEEHAKHEGAYTLPLYTHPAPVNQQLMEALRLAEDSLGAFVSDHGWSQQDMDNLDTVTAAIAQAEKGMK